MQNLWLRFIFARFLCSPAAGVRRLRAQAHPADCCRRLITDLSPGKVLEALVSVRPKLWKEEGLCNGFDRELQDLTLCLLASQNPTAACFLFDTASFRLPDASESGSRHVRPAGLPERMPRKIRNVQPVRCQGNSDQG